MKFYLTKKAQLEAEAAERSGGAVPAGRGARQEPRSPRRAAALPPAPASPSNAPEPALVGGGLAVASTAAAQPKSRSSLGAASLLGTSSASSPRSRSDAAPRKNPRVDRKVIAIGGEARVDLLPAEVRFDRRAGTRVRRAWLGVAGVAAVVGILVGAATLYAQSASDVLASSQARTTMLTEQATKYAPVKQIESQLDVARAARAVGGSTDIDWSSYLADVQTTLPSGMTLTTVAISSASPLTAYAQSATPLEGQRIATLTFQAASTTLPSVPTWLTNLSGLKGFVDATPGSVALSSGVYTSNVVVHINEKAFSNRYAVKGK